MRHRVAAKRVAAAAIRQELATGVSPGFEESSVLTTFDDGTRRDEVVVIDIVPGQLSEPAARAGHASVVVDEFRLEVGVLINQAGRTGDDAEDRCAAVVSRIEHILDSGGVEDVFASQHGREGWSIEAWRIVSADGPTTTAFGDQGVAAMARLELAVQIRIRPC